MKENPIGRSAILDAARATLVDVGVAALTVRAVAQGAGCSTTGIYTYFGGKQGVLDTLYAEAFGEFHDALYPGYGTDGSILGLHHAIRSYRAWTLAHPTQYQLMFAFGSSGYTPSLDVVIPTRRTFDALVDLVGHAVSHGDLRGEPLAIATHLWATQHGYMMLDLIGPGTLGADPEQAYFDGVSAAMSAYGARLPVASG